MAKIYLSSTYSDLVEHREAVYRTLRKLRHDVVAMEDYVATDERPLDKCLTDVAASDVYVGIFAWRCGFRPPRQDRSITELELDQAVALGKPCLIFILDDAVPWPPKQIDSGNDLTSIKSLRQRLQHEYTVSFFSTVDQLAASVGVAVTNALGKVPAEIGEHSTQDPARLRFYQTCLGKIIGELCSQIRFYSISSCALVALGVVVIGTGFMLDPDKSLIVSLGGGLISATTVYPLVNMRHARNRKAVLDGYKSELQNDSPPEEVLNAVRAYLSRQLQQLMESPS